MAVVPVVDVATVVVVSNIIVLFSITLAVVVSPMLLAVIAVVVDTDVVAAPLAVLTGVAFSTVIGATSSIIYVFVSATATVVI